MAVDLRPHQQQAVEELSDGKILKGGVGSGKSHVGIAYFIRKVCLSEYHDSSGGQYKAPQAPRPLYIFTTAKKREDLSWLKTAADFGISSDPGSSYGGIQVVVDSWNNITNYTEVKDAFIIFDEQRLVGSGAWVKAFYKIAKNNRWIVLSATPGDNWVDYIPVFVANGYYKNRTEFMRRHVVWNGFAQFPKIDHFVEVNHLIRLRHRVLVEMPYESHTIRHTENIMVEFDEVAYERAWKDRWHVFEDRPIKDISELFSVIRRITNTHPSRVGALQVLLEQYPRLIVFYNFNYELEILRTLATTINYPVREWNGHKHEEIEPLNKLSNKWLYLVQYTAGAEGWNCTSTNATLFYSLNYSYKITEQGKGRIDRLNTPYIDLFYFFLRSAAGIDTAIAKSLSMKQKFNENKYYAKAA